VYTITSKYKERAKIEAELKESTEKIKKLRDDIEVKDGLIAEQKKKEDAQKEVIGKKEKDYAALNTKYKNISEKFSKPLVKAEQDEFFTSRGFTSSWFQPGGGRLFSSDDTVLLQKNFVELDKRGEQVVNLQDQVKENKILTQLYMKDITFRDDKIKDLEEIDVARIAREEKLKEDIAIANTQIRNKKLEKWLYLLGGIAGGFAVGHVGK
jgi:hypothetical protein